MLWTKYAHLLYFYFIFSPKILGHQQNAYMQSNNQFQSSLVLF